MSDPAAEWTGPMERTLSWMRRLALFLMTALVACGAILTFLLRRPRVGGPTPTFETPTVLIAAGLLLILAASRIQTLVARRAARLSSRTLEAMVAGSAQGVAASWLLLLAAGGLGVAASILTSRLVTAWTFLAAAVVGILVRWPQRREMLRRAVVALGERA
jgi:hypothetical protein